MRLLVLDIETSPAVAYTWTLRKAFISPEQVLEPTRMLCWAAQWVGEKKVITGAEWDGTNFLGRLWELMDEADAVVHFNGRSFDVPHINREFVTAGMPPPSPYAQVDLYQTVKSQFRFMQSGLNNVVKTLELGGKMAHEGYALWTSVMGGDKAAQARMLRYCAQDVRITGTLYTELRPWIRNHPNAGLHSSGHVCPICGSERVQKRGIQRTGVSAFQRYCCLDCGSYSRSGRRLEGTDLRKV